MGNPRPQTPRVSKAEMRRRIAELEAQAAQPRELPPALAEAIESYRHASIPERDMVAIRPFIADAVLASGLTGELNVRNHRTHIAELAHYAMGRGLPLQIESVLTTELIDEFVRLGLKEASLSVAQERRRRLLWMARRANPGPSTPAKLAPLPYRTIRPCYTPAEMAVIRRIAAAQPTEARARDLQAVVGLAAGAGLDSQDMRHLRISDVHDRGTDGIGVVVHGPRPRLVMVRRDYEDLVRAAVHGRDTDALVLGQKLDRRNTAARALVRAAGYRVPDLDTSRLRATWLADLMTDPIPLAVILNAAGLKSARSLSDLLPHLGPWLEAKGLGDDTTLRGA